MLDTFKAWVCGRRTARQTAPHWLAPARSRIARPWLDKVAYVQDGEGSRALAWV